jgi:NADH-quinone oxidoreductase subunit M
MTENSSTILSWLTFLPLVGAVAIAALGSGKAGTARMVAQAVSAFSLIVAGFIGFGFDVTSGGMQFVQRLSWIPSLNVEYHLGIDGLGLVMIVLTSIVMLMAVCASKKDSSTGYYALMLFLQSGLYGAFTALDFFHWFLFWELCLIPAFFLIKLYGGLQRTDAALQFFVYTMVGSIALLVGFVGLYLATGTLDFVKLAAIARDGQLVEALDAKLTWTSLSGSQAYLLMGIGVLLGFAVKVPLFPFHTWLPGTYTQAPTAVTMVLTGVMSKLGIYGLLRLFLPIFPDALQSLLTPLLILSVATIVFAAAAALVQKDIKRIFAYSSVNHLGYCLLGIFAAASAGGDAIDRAAILSGVVLQTFNHGITAAALFCFLGYLEKRTGDRRGMDDFGGLRKVVPVFCGLMGVSLFASLGLPGLNGFVGEFLIFKGVYATVAWAAVVALPGLLITAVFILNLLQKVFSGPLNETWENMADLNTKERAIILPATVLMFALGIFPGLLLQMINPTIIQLMEGLK